MIAIDDDIDGDLDRVLWALSWRVQPYRDVQIQRGRNTDLDPSGAPVEDNFAALTYPDGLGGSQILIDATRAWAYPPVSLPSEDLMEDARKIWEELKLSELTPAFRGTGMSSATDPALHRDGVLTTHRLQFLVIRWTKRDDSRSARSFRPSAAAQCRSGCRGRGSGQRAPGDRGRSPPRHDGKSTANAR